VRAKEFERDFGSTTDARFLAARREVTDRVRALAASWN
jgi:hypothetical protein